jgi:acetyl-CoA C-acetyltransferase
MREVVIVGGTRTPVGAFGGSLKTVPAVELGSIVMRSLLERLGLRPVISDVMQASAPEKLSGNGRIELEKAAGEWDESAAPIVIDEVLMGQVLQSCQGQNTARQAMIRAGIPKETPATTVNKLCGSGMETIVEAANSIMAGHADVIIAGGHENMSMTSMALPKARWGHRMEVTGMGQVYDLMLIDGLQEVFHKYHMGNTAENIAELYGIGRQEQDELGVLSHQRAMAAVKGGLFVKEITPVTIRSRKGDTIFDTDERPMEADMETMGKLRPAFKKDGTVTAGNSSGVNDGAAAVLVMSAEKAAEMGLKPMARIRAYATGGVDPAYMGLGPVPAVKKALARAKMTLGDMDMIELNEAFAAQAIGCFRELGIETERPNEVGSGISLGHPIGCTGARQMVSAIHLMQRKGYSTGLVTMCIGGGMGMCMIIENN